MTHPHPTLSGKRLTTRRAAAMAGILFALFLLLSTTLNLWMVLIFPSWVFIISIYILFLNLKRQSPGSSDGMTASRD